MMARTTPRRRTGRGEPGDRAGGGGDWDRGGGSDVAEGRARTLKGSSGRSAARVRTRWRPREETRARPRHFTARGAIANDPRLDAESDAAGATRGVDVATAVENMFREGACVETRARESTTRITTTVGRAHLMMMMPTSVLDHLRRVFRRREFRVRGRRVLITTSLHHYITTHHAKCLHGSSTMDLE